MNSDDTIYAGGEVNVQSEGSLTLGAIVTPGVVRPATIERNVAIYGAGPVHLTARNNLGLHGADVESGGGNVELNSIAGNINVDNSALYAAGNAAINAAGHVDVEGSDVNQVGSVFAAAGSYVNLYNVFNDRYDASSSDAYLTDWNITAGSYVHIGADANVSLVGANIAAASGGVGIRASGASEVPAIRTGKGIAGVVSLGNIISISGSSITANKGDVEIQNGTTTTPPPLLPSLANNLNVTGGSAITANNGNVSLLTDEGVNLASSAVHASGSGGTTGNVTVNAGAGITVNGAAVTGDAADGTVTLNSVSRVTAIANGATVQSFYLDVNSPDGILIDGRAGGGVHLTGNTMNLKGSLTDGTRGITVRSADLTAYATVNMAAHTVSLTSVAFGAGSYDNFQTFYGALAANPNTGSAVQSGYLNFINGVTYAGTLVSSANQSTYVNPASGPGIFVKPL